MNSIKKFLDWLTSLLLIIVVGLILITLFSAYYSFGTMIFGVHEASAIKDFWRSEERRVGKEWRSRWTP